MEAVHASPVRAVLHVSGGAARSLGWLLSVPGASNTLLEARVPYAREAMMEVLGGAEPKQYVSGQTARDLAATAYKRGVRLTPPGQSPRDVVGVGCTCALASVPAKRGEHRCVVATYGVRGVAEYSLTMEKGRRDRWEEDGLASALVVQALADAAAEAADGRVDENGDATNESSSPTPTSSDLVGPAMHPPGDALTVTRTPMTDALEWVTSGAGDLVEVIDGVPAALGAVSSQGPGALVLPGSFNPLHDGHRGMLAAAAALRPGATPYFELAVSNADKGVLPVDEVRRRAAQFASVRVGKEGAEDGDRDGGDDAERRLLLTRAPLYVTKASLMPGATFVVGYDTAIRLVMPKYYGGEAGMMRAFDQVRESGCSFIVAGRVEGTPENTTPGGGKGEEGERFLTLSDVDVPESLRDLFEALPDFRMDISSTALRAAADR